MERRRERRTRENKRYIPDFYSNTRDKTSTVHYHYFAIVIGCNGGGADGASYRRTTCRGFQNSNFQKIKKLKEKKEEKKKRKEEEQGPKSRMGLFEN